MVETKTAEGQELQEQEKPLVLQDVLLTADVIKRAEAQVEGVNKIKILALKVTNSGDWVNQQGKPYLQNSGAMKIAQLFGINFVDKTIDVETITDDKGTYKMFTCKGTAEFHGRKVEDIGTCSTRDDFFGKKGGEYKAMEDVDLENIKKKCVTNWQNRVLKKILGLAYTIEDLVAAGIKFEGSAKVNYANGGAGGGLISEAQGKRLFAIMKAKNVGEELFRNYLSENYSYCDAHTKNIKREDYEVISKWLENGGK
jgi:hypothetical protein